MASRHKSRSNVSPHDIQVPASPKAVPPGGRHRQSMPQGLERTAQVLVHEAGSVHKAKSAIDKAAEMERDSDFREDQLAVRLGFASREEMLAASKPLIDAAGVRWWATRMSDGRWTVWSDETVKSTRHATLEEAKSSLADQQTANEPTTASAYPEGFNG
jgi:hypothetical protein